MEEHEGLTHTELLFTEIEAYKQPKKDTEYVSVSVWCVFVGFSGLMRKSRM